MYIVTHIDLANWHPFKVSPYGVHLTLINRDTAILDERSLSVVELGSAITVGVIGDFVVVPDLDTS